MSNSVESHWTAANSDVISGNPRINEWRDENTLFGLITAPLEMWSVILCMVVDSLSNEDLDRHTSLYSNP